MSSQTAEVLKAAMDLSRDQRAELVSLLWEVVEQELAGELSPKWKAEIKRRIQRLERGEATLLTQAQFDQRLKDRYGSLAD
jgi:putative addiction module component (TIGR02574 family)